MRSLIDQLEREKYPTFEMVKRAVDELVEAAQEEISAGEMCPDMKDVRLAKKTHVEKRQHLDMLLYNVFRQTGD